MIVMRWIPFIIKNGESGYLDKQSVLHLSVPPNLREMIKERITKNGNIPKEDVYVSEQIVTGNDLFTDQSIRYYLTDRATEELTGGVRFKKSLYDEQTIPTDVIFLQLYYVTVAVRSETPTEVCFENIYDEELQEAFKTVYDGGLMYTYGALDWEEAFCDYVKQLRGVKKVIDRKRRFGGWFKSHQ